MSSERPPSLRQRIRGASTITKIGALALLFALLMTGWYYLHAGAQIGHVYQNKLAPQERAVVVFVGKNYHIKDAVEGGTLTDVGAFHTQWFWAQPGTLVVLMVRKRLGSRDVTAFNVDRIESFLLEWKPD